MNYTFLKIMMYRIILLCLLVSATICAKRGKQNKKCSQVLSRIPVEKKFDLNKFLGTWYHVKRTRLAFGDNTFESSTIDFNKNADDTYSYSYTGKLGDTCIPVKLGMLEASGRPGQFVLNDLSSSKDLPTMIVSFTDYNKMAMIYYCFEYKRGRKDQCVPGSMHVVIMSRSEKPKKKDIRDYVTRAWKRLCAPEDKLVSTEIGMCKIPDILEAAKRKKGVGADKKASGSFAAAQKCAVNNIPVQKEFTLSQMEGLWYEIARTRFTFNNLDSVVSYHRFDADENHINSYYTGVKPEAPIDNPCNTPIEGMSKTKSDGAPIGDMIGRIGGEDSSWPWSPMKVLYAEDNYLMFYACYGGESDEPCLKSLTEVTLVGRSRDIDVAARDSLYSKLSDICINPQDMIKTRFTANCSSWVSVQTDQQEVKPSDCLLDEIPVYEDYDNLQMEGTWYLHASFMNNLTKDLSGVVMEKIIRNPIGTVQTTMSAFSTADQTCVKYGITARDRCLDTGDHIVTRPWLERGTFVFSKVMYLSDELFVEYVCTQKTIDGTCDTDGVSFQVYTRNNTVADGELGDASKALVKKLAKSACLDPNTLTYETNWCSLGDTEGTVDNKSRTSQECDIDNIAVFSDVDDFNQDQIYGYWYEIARSDGTQFWSGVDSLVAYFTSDSNETLQIYYTGLVGDADNQTCAEINRGSLLARCVNDTNADYLARFTDTYDHVSYVPFKIIYTDFTNVLLTYVCEDVQHDGICSATGAHVRIWGRNTTLSEEAREDAQSMIYWACVDPEVEGYMVEATHNDSGSCFNYLNDYVIENAQEDSVVDNDDSDDESESNKGDKAQKDETRDALDDIQALLWMDDDEFYST